MAVKRQVFYSFHYSADSWRASLVRNIGAIEGNRPAPDNDWESITRGGDAAIKKWIMEQLKYRSCTVVLVGANTANRRWINFEIIESWNAGMGIVGIRVHGLMNQIRETSSFGENPFEYITHGPSQQKLSSLVKCYNPSGANSAERYNWIAQYLSSAVEEAISIRNKNN